MWRVAARVDTKLYKLSFIGVIYMKLRKALYIFVLVLLAVFLIQVILAQSRPGPGPGPKPKPTPKPTPAPLIGGCAGTRYGCCPDGRTPRANYRGTNCY